MRLPKDFVKENLKKGKGSTFFDVPIEDLSNKELKALAISGWIAQQKEANRCSTCLFKRTKEYVK